MRLRKKHLYWITAIFLIFIPLLCLQGIVIWGLILSGEWFSALLLVSLSIGYALLVFAES